MAIGDKKSGVDGWYRAGTGKNNIPIYKKDSQSANSGRSGGSTDSVRLDFASASSERKIDPDYASVDTPLKNLDLSEYSSSDPFEFIDDQETYSLYSEDGHVISECRINDNPHTAIANIVGADTLSPQFDIYDEGHDFPDDYYEAYNGAMEHTAQHYGLDCFVESYESDSGMVNISKSYDMDTDDANKDFLDMRNDFSPILDDVSHSAENIMKEKFYDILKNKGYDTNNLLAFADKEENTL